MLSEEQLIQNYEKYKSLLLQTGDHRSAQLEALIDHFGNRFVLCPASSKKQLHAAYPGGLIDHSLRVLKNATRMIKVAQDVYGDIPDESVVFAALFHDLGKTGDGVVDYYVPNKSDWHRERGILYEINKECRFMQTSERGLFILQNYGITMSYDEYLAIRLNDGMYDQTNAAYRMNEPKLALLTHWADMMACKHEKS